MRAPDRHRSPARATRAYVAGFGTSGSLLAAAAAVFLVGSAIVAFKGWPQIGIGAPNSNVAAAPIPVASRAARRLSVVLAARALPATRALARPAPVRLARPARPSRGRSSVQGTVVTGTPATAPAPAAGVAESPGSNRGGSSACSACDTATQPAVTHVSRGVANTVSKVGSDVGQQLTSFSGTVANQIAPASPTVASTVQNIGSAVGKTVAGTTSTVGKSISALGGAVAGLP